MIKNTIFFALLASLTVSSGLLAQYRWHTILPDRIDTFYCGVVSISCSGESCSAVGYVWGYTPGEPGFKQMPDSNFIIHSTDGGQTWNSVDSTLPQRYYTWNSTYGLLLKAIDQIDSLDAIAVGTGGTIIRTFDGWNTWHEDTSTFKPVVYQHDTSIVGFEGVDFSNAAEGYVFDNEDGLAFATVDTGKHWFERSGGHSYGNGMFRSFIESNTIYTTRDQPDTILTTYDNWNTVDTSLLMLRKL